jgi:hypothetical protein
MDDAVNACPLRCFELRFMQRMGAMVAQSQGRLLAVDGKSIRRGHGPRNMSRLRRMAMNLLKAGGRCTQRQSTKGRRKIAGWDHQFLLKLIAG